MKFDFVVLGATGMQGKIVSKDLLENGYSVLMCGRDLSRIENFSKYKGAKIDYVDLKDIKNASIIIKNSGSNIVINCAEGDWNLNALEACTKAGANSIDLGSEIWMTKKQFGFDKILKQKELTHITGCGSVPGIGNVMLRHGAEKLDSISKVEVGFAWNSNIKKFVVPFSMESIIEEFTDPATNVKGGKFVKIKPMDSLKETTDKFVGEEESFFVRHPETYTFYNYFKDKGLKNVNFYAEFPKHSFEVIKTLIDIGFGSKNEINVDGVKVKPVRVLTEVLKNIKMPEKYEEKEDLWVTMIGKKDGDKKVIEMNCIVPTLDGWEDAGCNIDTGIPASIIAQMIKNKIINQKGSFAPEAVVPPGLFFEEIAKRKMVVLENGKRIN